ncbi:hypothetical protein EOL96_07560 [Candidatus Saccharibacteria bacterium]|nr:hypothetical protein [Candidatus Saccharibacteria bacterium]
MSKKALILHGTNGSPTELAWQTWLQDVFKSNGYDVFFPQLPKCHTPDVAVYDAFLRGSGQNFTDGIIVGHSSGSTEALHLLQQDWFPHVRATILVGTFLNERLVKAAEWYEPGQFDALFVDELDVETIKQKSDRFYFVHGDNDPYCDYGEAKELCTTLDGTLITMKGAGHIGSTANILELPELVVELQRDNVL